ncbi:hypothetical protein ACFFJT_11540 [Dyella flava]|uniref:Uncharacterized protein n=1 Tax=Dyella flava TaxID=1920170 RepID=A0ABS2K861_9GAMM|nr:hypothetical protein [Dyella flava]MBM7127099.1 hypothetical protein [Dyella flava]
MQMLKDIRSNLLKTFRFRHGISWLILISMVLGLTLVLSVGSAVQSWIVGIASSNHASIYESVYHDNLIQPIDYRSWILWVLCIDFPVMAIAIVALGLTAVTARRISLHLTVCTMIVLTLDDAIRTAMAHTITVADMAVNIVCNAAGSIFIAAWVIGTLKVAGFLALKMRTDKGIVNVFALLTPVLFGLLTTSIVFETCKVMFEAVPIRLQATLRPGASAWYSRKIDAALLERDDQPADPSRGSEISSGPFDWYPVHNLDGQVFAVSPAQSVQLTWRKPSDDRKFDLTIQQIMNCSWWTISSLKSGSDVLKFKDVHSMAAAFDGGGEISSVEKSTTSMHAALVADDSRGISIQNGSTKGTLQFQQMVGNASLTYGGGYDGLTAALTTYLFRSSNDAVIPTSRELTLTIDGKVNRVKLMPQWSKVNKHALCESISPLTLGENGLANETLPDAVTAGIVVTIQPEQLRQLTTLNSNGEFKVSKINGWVALNNIQTNSAPFSSNHGMSTYLTMYGKNVDLKADDRVLKLEPDDLFFIEGPLELWVDSDDHIKIAGIGKFIYKNNVRFNKTLWEELSWSYRSVIVGLLATALWWVAKQIWKWVASDGSMPILERKI